MTLEELIQTVAAAVLDRATFVRAVFSGPGRALGHEWRRVLVRPVVLKSGDRWQVSHFDERKDITKNYDAEAVLPVLSEIASLGFRNIEVEARGTVTRWRTSGSGFSCAVTKRQNAAPLLDHDRKKPVILDPRRPAPFLERLGFVSGNSVKPTKQDKLAQINAFLRLLEETGAYPSATAPFSVVDFGCGNAYLTFALYHRLANDLGLNASVTGVDLKEDLLARHRTNAGALGWSGLTFEAGSIQNYGGTAPDAVVALHACDTATDDAIARGLAWGSRLIVVAPCCHHHLQVQLARRPQDPALAPVFRHGLTAERLGDVLTDAFRALLLRIHGYKTDVVQFVDPENSPKNLMIRAVKTATPAPASFQAEYEAMKAFWGVTPYLETKLAPAP